MSKNINHEILSAFETYKNTVFTVTIDLDFWQSFLKLSINEYKAKIHKPDKVYSAIFAAYNINIDKNEWFLKTLSDSRSLKTMDLDEHRKDFFSWVTILSILKTYNALEIFLLQSIKIRYFPKNDNPIESKKAVEQIQKGIKKYLQTQDIKIDVKNNRHIIQFLKSQSPKFNKFINLTIKNYQSITWEDFFELISILRNVIAHHGTIIPNDTHNQIKSKGKIIFQQHFNMVKDSNGKLNLKPIDTNLLNFINIFNSFALNSVKTIYDRKDLSIFKL